MSDSFPPHGLQHTRLPCPSPTPRACSNSCPSSQGCQTSSSPPAFNLSNHRGLFQRVSSLYQLAKVLELQLQHQSFQWIFRIDWFDFLAVPGTLKSLLQHHSSKASILQHSAFFMVQLSHPYKTIGKTRALSRWTFVNKVMSLLFNTLSRLLIVFSSKDQGLLILWAAVTICSDFGAPQNKVYHCFHWFPVYLPWSDGTRCHDLGFLNVEF